MAETILLGENQSWIGEHSGDSLYLAPVGDGIYALQAKKSGEEASEDAIWIADTDTIELRSEDADALRRWIGHVLTEHPGCLESKSAARAAFERHRLVNSDIPELAEPADYFDANMEIDRLVERILNDANDDGVRLRGGETAVRALLLDALQ